ncbi:MAG: alpha/beta hydrolase [Pseudomonadota bacterium]
MRHRIERFALQHLLARLPDALLNRIAGGPVRFADRTLHPLLAAMMAANRGPGMETLSPEQARRAYGRIIATTDAERIEMANVRDETLVVTGGSIRVRRYQPLGTAPGAPAILFFHGGGMTVGDIDQYDNTARYIAAQTQCLLFSVDYRCGPEHRFPTGVEDAIAAWRWLHDNAHMQGIDPARVALMGDSAGGYLSAAVAMAARDRGLSAPKVQCLVYPVVDQRLVSPSISALGQGFGLTEPLVRWFANNYARNEADRNDPLASPLLASSHANLAPAIITVAGFDPLHDEGVEYAGKLRAAGVPVELLRHNDLTHAWFTMTGAVPPARAAMDETCAAVRRALG